MKIIWSYFGPESEVAAFSFESIEYYIYFGPGIPKILDKEYNVLTIPNLDNWVYHETKNRHSFRNLYDIASAFYSGMQLAYTEEDLSKYLSLAIELTIKKIARSTWLYDLSTLYWLESSSTIRLDEYIVKLRDKFDKVNESIGEDDFYNTLCRLHKLCLLRNNGYDSVVENLIHKLNRVVKDPIYPPVDNIYNAVKYDILAAVDIYKDNKFIDNKNTLDKINSVSSKI